MWYNNKNSTICWVLLVYFMYDRITITDFIAIESKSHPVVFNAFRLFPDAWWLRAFSMFLLYMIIIAYTESPSVIVSNTTIPTMLGSVIFGASTIVSMIEVAMTAM